MLGHRVRDLGNVAVPQAEELPAPAPGEPLRYLEPLIQVNLRLAELVASAIAEGCFPLILGGDHSLAIGLVNGVAQGRRVGVLWVDAHGDFNTPATTPSGNIHDMGVAALTGRGDPRLTHLLGHGPVLRDSDIAMVLVFATSTRPSVRRCAARASRSSPCTISTGAAWPR